MDFMSLLIVLTVMPQFVWGKIHGLLCKDKHYYDSVTEKCELCTRCPLKSITYPCTSFQDTVCMGDYKGIWPPMFRTKDPNVISVQHATDSTTESAPVELLSDQWYTISMALFGTVCVLCLILTFLGIHACLICKRKGLEKEIFYDSRFIYPHPTDSEEPRYVQAFPSSRDRLRQNKYRISSTYANDSTNGPINPLLMPNTNIYVNMMDSGDYCTIDEHESSEYVNLN